MVAGGFDIGGLPSVPSQSKTETGMKKEEWVYHEFETHPKAQERSGFGWSAFSFQIEIDKKSFKLQAVKGKNSGIKIRLFEKGKEEPILEAYPRGNNSLTVCSNKNSPADIVLLRSAFRFAFDHSPLIVPEICHPVPLAYKYGP